MKNILKARKGGFTLVELLIVIIIIAILAGMMLLTTGSATDGAEATKLVSNLRSMKAAALLYFIDNGQTWIDGTDAAAIVESLSPYMDRSIDVDKYNPTTVNLGDRRYIGFKGGSIWGDKPGVMKKLANMAKDSGLTNVDGTPYTESNAEVYMNLR